MITINRKSFNGVVTEIKINSVGYETFGVDQCDMI